MKKRLLLLSLLISGMANAGLITVTVGEFNGYGYTGTDTPYDLSDFSFNLNGETIQSARLEGVWGQTQANTGSTAHGQLYVDGLLVSDTHDPDLPCDPYHCVANWSYSFTDLAPLLDGVLDFRAVQTSPYILRLGATTLTVETILPAPDPVSVPEPAPLGLMGMGLLIAGFRHKSPRSRQAEPARRGAGLPAHSSQ